jgi:hexosaminidase
MIGRRTLLLGLAALALRGQDIIPRPERLTPGAGSYALGAATRIHAGPGARAVAESLREALRPATGLALPVTDGGASEGLVLALDERAEGLGDEGYTLKVTPRGAWLTARRPAGLFWAVQTLRQLLPPAALREAPVAGVAWTLPALEIEDRPRFPWRGSHLDTGRHFMPVAFLKRHLDLMALHKLNTFHWHLTEDQGWRLQIRRHPRLAEVGGWRRHTMVPPYPARKEHLRFDGAPHGGFYTQDDVREIVAYAAARFITVVPEIEMPGHATAAIVAYPELGNRLEPPAEVPGHWGIHRTVLNPDDATLRFFQGVLEEVLELFPSRFIHVGGDECPKDEWKASPAAQARIKALGLKDEDALQSWFIRQMDAWLAARGRRLVGWDEILEGGLADGAVVMSWRGEQGGIEAALAGHDVVMAPNSHTYFDHYQSKTTAEPFAWGGFLPLEKVYGYEPVPAALPADRAKHVLGAQGQLWTEYMPTPERVMYMAWPRLSALAEVVWTPRARKDYPEFLGRLRTHYRRFEALGVPARPLDGPVARPGQP